MKILKPLFIIAAFLMISKISSAQTVSSTGLTRQDVERQKTEYLQANPQTVNTPVVSEVNQAETQRLQAEQREKEAYMLKVEQKSKAKAATGSATPKSSRASVANPAAKQPAIK